MPNFCPFWILFCIGVLTVELVVRIGELDKPAVGVILVRCLQKSAILPRAVEKMVRDGDDDLGGELFRLSNTFSEKAKIVRAVTDDCPDSHIDFFS